MGVRVTIGNLAPKGVYNVSFDLDDSSIVVDAESEREKKLQELSAGVLSPKAYLMETRGITEKEAKKLMPGVEELTKNVPGDD